MKKTLIASAVAAATLATNVMAMDNTASQDILGKLDAMPTVYGSIELIVGYEDAQSGGSAYGFTDGTPEDSGYGMADNGSTIGFKHKHEVAPGLEAFFKAEFEFVADEGAGLGGFDEAFIGLKGDFGQVLIGKEDTVYEWIDVTDHFDSMSTPTEIDVTGETNQIQYVSPDMSGFQLGVSVQVKGEDADGNNHRNGVVVAAKYTMDNLTVSAAVDSADGQDKAGESNAMVIGLGVAYSMDDLGLAFSYETQDENQDVISLLGTYSMGSNTFALAYTMNSYDAGADTSQISLQALHSVSDNMYVYAEGYMVDLDGPEDNAVYMGAVYAF